MIKLIHKERILKWPKNILTEANPIPIIIPCHRVIGASGALVGFGGGLDVKKYLLDLESDSI